MDLERELDRIDDQLLELSSGYSALRLLLERGFAVEHRHDPQPFIDMVDRLISATERSAKPADPMQHDQLLEQVTRVVLHLRRFRDSTLARMADV